MSNYFQKKYQKLNPFKSQKGQDWWVITQILPFKRRGIFLDLAAADGFTHSNTFVLEKVFGWKGLCIEPNPAFYEVLQRKRNCKLDNAVISNQNEEVIFRIDNGQLGGIIAQDTDNNYTFRADQLKTAKTLTMSAFTINEILRKHQMPQVIDYLSLDVEGSEERIISSMDWNTYQFNCITIERPSPKVNEILFENGYVFVKNYSFDSFYVHQEILKRRNIKTTPFEQIPAKDW